MRHSVSLVAGLLFAASGVSIAAPEASLEDLATPPAPPALPNQAERVLCLVDTNFDDQSSNPGTWSIQVGGGLITGTVIYSGCPPFNVSGTYSGPDFTIDMVLSEPSSCCESGVSTGIVNVPDRNATGTITWMCNGVPTPGAATWTLCP